MTVSVIYENRNSGVTINVGEDCDPGFEEFLNNIVWGSDGFLYTEKIKLDQLTRFGNVHYVSLWKGQVLSGLAVVHEKMMEVGAEGISAYYMTNFAVSEPSKSSIYVSLMVKHATRYFKEVLGDRGLMYAYIEKENLASKRIANGYGYNSIRSFEATMFIKLFCRVDPAVRSLREDEAGAMLRRLEEKYTGQAFTDFKSSLRLNDYFVCERDGSIIAGIQQDTMTWSVQAYPGLTGYFLLEVLPRIPLLNKVFKPKNLVFLKFGNFYVQEGFESELVTLIQSLLRKSGTNLGMVQLDTSCPVMSRVIKQCKLGVLKISGEVDVVANYHQLSEKNTAVIESSPIHISLADK